MDFMGAFILLGAIQTRPELRSVSKYDVTNSDMTSSVNTFLPWISCMDAFRLLVAI